MELEKELEELSANRKRKMSELPEEPLAGSDVITLAIRLATGSRLTRRFSKNTTVQVIKKWLRNRPFTILCTARRT